MYDDLFRDLDKALVMKQEIHCFKQKTNDKIRWVVEIEDPHRAKDFESRILGFLERMKGRIHVSDNTKETL